MKFTFKKHARSTGLAGVGNPYQNVDIKLNKKVCGAITAPNWRTKDNKWTVGVTVLKTEEEMKEEPNCTWRWYRFKARFDNEADARYWVNNTLKSVLLFIDKELHFSE